MCMNFENAIITIQKSQIKNRTALSVQYQTTSEIVSLLAMSEKSVQCILTSFNDTGDVEATNHHGPEMMLLSFEEMVLIQGAYVP